MKNPNNPINRFARYLGKSAQNVSDDLGVGISTFQKQSAKKPEELMKLIEDKTSFSFAQKNQAALSQNVSESEKTIVCADLLVADSKKNNAFRNNDLRLNQDVKIVKGFLPNGLPHYTVEDIEAGTPLSPGGNLLTQEFAKLLYLDDKALTKLGRLSPVINLDVRAIGKKCPEYTAGNLTVGLLIQALREELAKITGTLALELLKEVRFLEEVAIIEGVFAKLKTLYFKESALNESELSLRERLKEWFCSQFNLSKKDFTKAMKSGNIVIIDARNRSASEANLDNIDVEHLGMVLKFEDEVPTFYLPQGGQ